MEKVLIWNLKPGNLFEKDGDQYVRGNFCDERSVHVTRLHDGKSKVLMANVTVMVET